MNYDSHNAETTKMHRADGDCTVTIKEKAPKDNMTAPFTESSIYEYLAKLGFRTNFTGTMYLSRIISMICSGELTFPFAVTKDIYPVCAKIYGTTASAVEKCIRHAIEINISETESDCLFGGYPKLGTRCPSNKEVICYLANHMKILYNNTNP